MKECTFKVTVQFQPFNTFNGVVLHPFWKAAALLCVLVFPLGFDKPTHTCENREHTETNPHTYEIQPK